jgi:hypothetical protein
MQHRDQIYEFFRIKFKTKQAEVKVEFSKPGSRTIQLVIILAVTAIAIVWLCTRR